MMYQKEEHYLNKALFLDRDGVINTDKSYVGRIKEFQFLNGIFHLLQGFQKMGYLLIVVTNQSGVERGYFTRDAVERIHTYMQNELMKRDIKITAVYYCTSADSRHPDRKPNPGMLLKAQEDFNIDMPESILIGDSVSDITAGRRAGVGYNFLYCK